MAKAPKYETWDDEKLDAESGRRYARMQEIGLAISDDMDPQERFDLELERGEHRAHLNIIAPLRTQRLVHAQRLADSEVHRLAGMTDEEFAAHQAKMAALRQEIRVAGGPEGAPEEPGVA